MSLMHRTPIIVCVLLLASLVLPGAIPTNAQAPAPSLAAATMAASPFGTVAVTGQGFTPGGLVRVIIHDLWGLGPTTDFWVVAPLGAIDEQFPYLTSANHGPNGSQDPAQGYVAGTLPGTFETTALHGPNGSQDPAQGYVNADILFLWSGGCPDLEVRGWDARTDTWSNSLDVELAGC